ncbi:MAG: Coenzyme F420 hydrogenase/dehydrogenase, beta subunit C-terminal domain [Sedimentisphaerales bacterium]|nr:Coenzyme F420 hydrogenase/dehydrogenase, beta subunit C-terminal domain [Sedimentisphaerales bacterium]
MSSNETDDESVLQRVVRSGLCVGCGMCAGLLPDILRMRTNEYGQYVPEPATTDAKDWGPHSLQVCPFADNADDEDTIAAALFAEAEGIRHRPETGYYLRCFAGHVTCEEARMAATSGGIITWLAGELLSAGQVDAVACVAPADEGPNLFEFRLITDPAELAACKKSRYYPVEVSQIIPKIKASPGKVLFVALPCFLKALHLAMKVDAELRSRIAGTIGLVCGHLKTKKYAAYLARHCGVSESRIRTVDFRLKVPGRPANKYAFSVSLQNGADDHREILMQNVWASSWSNNLFMLQACECCDDVFAETADVVVGDAWLGEYLKDHRGTSIVVCRSPQMLDVLNEGRNNGQLALTEISAEKVIQSQAGAIRQRRAGLQYRLYLAARKQLWRPRKRVAPSATAGSWLFRCLQRLRIKLRALSKEAFLAQEPSEGLDLFIRRLRPWVRMSESINLLRHAPTGLKRRLASLAATHSKKDKSQ